MRNTVEDSILLKKKRAHTAILFYAIDTEKECPKILL